MNKNEILRKIPQIDEIINYEKLKDIRNEISHNFLIVCIREVISEYRTNILNNVICDVDKNDLVDKIILKTRKKLKTNLRRIINATGTVLHTNLGRALLSKRATESIIEVATCYSNLEYDLKKGNRGYRLSNIEKIITELTGCEAAMVVNNNAAATILTLTALAYNKEVLISRGELIEIGGSFRLPNVMEESGAILREIGSTNKTRISDYRNAIDSEKTAVILKVHTSNYRIVGFSEEASLNELKQLGIEYNLPVIYDMGNGLFVDLNEYGIDEPTVLQLVKNGADLILFSGDKLLGGPQSGIIIGKAKYINKMKTHPLARAFRVDKFTIASLYATLFEYFDEEKAKKNIPILSMITISNDELKQKANNLCDILKQKFSDKLDICVEEVLDQIGGGTAPNVSLNGYAVSIFSNKISAEKLERKFREVDVPIIVRVSHDKIYFDVRTILDEDIDVIVDEIYKVLI